MIKKEYLPEQKDIETQLTEQDIKYLEQYAREVRLPNCYVEIGTMRGGSALVVARQIDKMVSVYSIDPHPHFEQWEGREELCGIDFIRGFSKEISEKWDKSIQMLFIDGHHDEAKYDFNYWDKFVVPGGIVVFHDFAKHSPQVIRDCIDIILARSDYRPVIWPGINTSESKHVFTSSMFIMRKI